MSYLFFAVGNWRFSFNRIRPGHGWFRTDLPRLTFFFTSLNKIYFPEKAKILKALKEFANRRNLIQANDELDCFQKAGQIERLQVDFDGSECALEGENNSRTFSNIM